MKEAETAERADSLTQPLNALVCLLTNQKQASFIHYHELGDPKRLPDVFIRRENQSTDTEGGTWEDTEMVAFLSHKCSWTNIPWTYFLNRTTVPYLSL